MMVVKVTLGSTFAAGTPRGLFDLTGYRGARNRQQYDVTPDDQHFVMIREPADDEGRNVIYAEHWLVELQARMKARR
jgi:hypothetical protein